MKTYSFNIWNRGNVFLKSLSQEKRPVEDFFIDFVAAAAQDLQELVDSAFPHFFMQKMKDEKTTEVMRNYKD